jgi:NDP-sugar pyrophosphorylase family protein
MTITGRLTSGSVTAAATADIECVVLCGGLGTRLAPVVSDRPKALAEVAGRPFIESLLLALKRSGVRRFVLATGHLGDQLEEHLGDGSHLGVAVTYSPEPTPLGTGGALRLALSHTSGERLLVVNGDSYCRADVGELVARHLVAGARVTLLLVATEDRSRYGAVTVDCDGWVTGFSEKSPAGPGWISAGIYVVEREVIEALAAGRPLSVEADLLPALAGHGLHAVTTQADFVDIGTPESYWMAAGVINGDAADALVETATNPSLHHVTRHLRETIAVQEKVLSQCAEAIAEAALLIAGAFAGQRKLLICGNGGSAADCQHMAAEFMSRLRKEFERPALPAIALTTDSSFLTAFANDCGYDGVFARQVDGLGQPGDVLLGISTSGGSSNVARALEAAKRRGVRTVGLFGDGAPLAASVDVAIVVPSRSTQVVQECMLSIEHIICELVEDTLFPDGPAPSDQGDPS